MEDSGVRSLSSGTSCPEICSAGFLILRSTGNTPVTHPLSGAYITSSRKASRGAHSTFLAATRRSKEVAEEALGPLTHTGSSEGSGWGRRLLPHFIPFFFRGTFQKHPRGAWCRMQGGSLRAQSQVGWGLWGTSGHTRHPWDQPTEVYAACKPSLTALCALLGAGLFCSTKGNIRLGDRGDKTAPN